MKAKRIPIESNIVRTAFEDADTRAAIRARLIADGTLKTFTREEGAASFDTFIASERSEKESKQAHSQK